MKARSLLQTATTAAVMVACSVGCASATTAHSDPPSHLPSHLPSSLPSDSNYTTETATPTPPGAVAIPPSIPCDYPSAETALPDSDDNIESLLESSDLVVEADVEQRFQQLGDSNNEVTWSQLLSNVRVLAARTTPATVVHGLSVEGDPGKPPYAWTPGRYVLFLLPVYGGVSTPTNGMAGMFRVVDGQALRQCVDYLYPASPLSASGSPPTINALLAQIPAALPTDIVPAKPIASSPPS